ncbi:hypothetical protein TTHERM_00688370 (macronuclear) [Tetrahymena thermophila SB210]|uniref:Uncharacterized protein n=1 Tax=Tetrahymena thermophila (strain SB210) TaxID=312017 RepID=I7M4F0_TETTS|nr:hypothetical protein TTHERM_00688370 [Tetrahymena thermophila SB210]EAS06697.1 hypothetical protein TTHERM_00688370 [Tetrahymena thermophila SB210]|eukprot:XP_001026939.1 hypothetical protein TTHERM_00688370 [Tetrahymena thermophila SB210]
MCDLIQISSDYLSKQVPSQQPTTPQSQGTNSTTLSQKSQTDNFEAKTEDSPSTSSSTQTLQLVGNFYKNIDSQEKQNIADKDLKNVPTLPSQNDPIQNLYQVDTLKEKMIQQYQQLDRFSLIQMLIEEKKKNHNLLKAYTRDTEKLKSEILQLQREIIQNQEKEYQSLNNNNKNLQNHKHSQSVNPNIFNSCKSEQIERICQSCADSGLKRIQSPINSAFNQTFSNLQQQLQQDQINNFGSVNLVQSYSSSISNPTQLNKQKSNDEKQFIFSSQNSKQKLQSNNFLYIQEAIPLSQGQGQQKQNQKKEKISQSVNQISNSNPLSKSTTEYELKYRQTEKLLKFLEDLVIKCSPSIMFKDQQKPSEKQIWKFVKTMTEEYVNMKKQELINSQIINSLKDIFKASSFEKVVQLAKLQCEEVSILRKKMYNQNYQQQIQVQQQFSSINNSNNI